MFRHKRLKKVALDSQEGQTLVELIAAMAILTFALGGIFTMLLTGYRTSLDAEKRTKAVYLGQSGMERAANADLTSVVTPTYSLPDEDYASISGYPDFKRQTMFSKYKATDLYKVDVSVYWKNSFGEQWTAFSSLRSK